MGSRTDPVVRTADQATAAGTPVLGFVAAAPATPADDLAEYDRLRTRLQSMSDRTGGTKDQGHVLVLASTVGEVETAPIPSNFGRSMELASTRLIVLNACARRGGGRGR
jgi:hypothetical protein